MSYLVDSNVPWSATRPDPDLRVIAWLRAHEGELVVDPVILGEIRFGIVLLPRGQRRQRLERWFDEGVRRIHCLPWEAATGLCWAGLLADLRAPLVGIRRLEAKSLKNRRRLSRTPPYLRRNRDQDQFFGA